MFLRLFFVVLLSFFYGFIIKRAIILYAEKIKGFSLRCHSNLLCQEDDHDALMTDNIAPSPVTVGQYS